MFEGGRFIDQTETKANMTRLHEHEQRTTNYSGVLDIDTIKYNSLFPVQQHLVICNRSHDYNIHTDLLSPWGLFCT